MLATWIAPQDLASRMGTQHANEATNNARLVGKFGRSYPIFARVALRAAHDAISGETLDLLRLKAAMLKYQPIEREIAVRKAEKPRKFPCQ